MSLLLSALAADVAQGTAPPICAEEDYTPPGCGEVLRPYLRYVGPPPLRFQEPPPPPELSPRPPPAGPTKLGEKAKPDIVRIPELDVPVRAPSPTATTPVTSAPESPEAAVPNPPPAPPTVPVTPPPLVPDDAGRKVKPEDFLPFFQFPGAPPPSTATYQQQ